MAGSSFSGDAPPLNYRSSNLSSFGFNNSSLSGNNNSTLLSTPLGRVHTSVAPPIPPRPYRSNYNSCYPVPFNSFMNGGYSGYNNYGSYGFGNFRPNFSLYNSLYPESRFIQLAEESSRPAFQSIHSVLQAFSSVTMMFESTFHAIYSSYMSVLGVADNFAKLRNTFGQVFSTFAIIRTLNWIFKKLMSILGINKDNFTKETVWSDAIKAVSNVDTENVTKSKSKIRSTLLFVSLMFGGPYLLFKLISEIQPTIGEIWTPSKQPGNLAIALYDFNAQSEQELSMSAQQKIMIAPKKFQPTEYPGWVLACNENKKIGLIPNNHVGIFVQSEKTGQTFIEHNGQTYQSVAIKQNLSNTFEDSLKSVDNRNRSETESLINTNME